MTQCHRLLLLFLFVFLWFLCLFARSCSFGHSRDALPLIPVWYHLSPCPRLRRCAYFNITRCSTGAVSHTILLPNLLMELEVHAYLQCIEYCSHCMSHYFSCIVHARKSSCLWHRRSGYRHSLCGLVRIRSYLHHHCLQDMPTESVKRASPEKPLTQAAVEQSAAVIRYWKHSYFNAKVSDFNT